MSRIVVTGDRYLYIGADNKIECEDALNEQTGNYLNSATVTFTLKTLAGVAVTGAIAVTMPYVAASNGKYQGILESTVSLTEEAYYYLEIDLAQGGIVDHWRGKVQAVYKG